MIATLVDIAPLYSAKGHCLGLVPLHSAGGEAQTTTILTAPTHVAGVPTTVHSKKWLPGSMF